MPQTPVEEILHELDSTDPHEAWVQFLTDYSGQIYQVIRYVEQDADRAADCFQFVCEQLAEDRSRRLRKFQGGGSATFATWLRSVVRNLCIDWHRREFGRRRPFRSISRLPLFDQEVFRLIYERGVSSEESLATLASAFPGVTPEQLAQSRERIENGLTENQRWLLASRAGQQRPGGEAAPDEPESLAAQVPDPRPDPEAQAIMNQGLKRLKRALHSLSPQERLLVLLRFEQDLTLQQTAKVLGLGNAQRADRQLKEILARLRQKLG